MHPIRNITICKAVSKLKDEELRELFSEIYDYREKGYLKPEQSKLSRLQRELSQEDLRVTEDAVLFEMARRYESITAPLPAVNGDNLPDDMDAFVLEGTPYLKLKNKRGGERA